jgi:hypothetical protein
MLKVRQSIQWVANAPLDCAVLRVKVVDRRHEKPSCSNPVSAPPSHSPATRCSTSQACQGVRRHTGLNQPSPGPGIVCHVHRAFALQQYAAASSAGGVAERGAGGRPGPSSSPMPLTGWAGWSEAAGGGHRRPSHTPTLPPESDPAGRVGPGWPKGRMGTLTAHDARAEGSLLKHWTNTGQTLVKH